MSLLQKKQEFIQSEFSSITQWEERYKKIIALGQTLPQLASSMYQDKFLVKGCQSRVWLHAQMDNKKHMILQADSEALIVRGLIYLLIEMYSGLTPREVLDSPPTFIKDLGFEKHLSPSRSNGLLSMIQQIKLYAKAFEMQMSLEKK